MTALDVNSPTRFQLALGNQHAWLMNGSGARLTAWREEGAQGLGGITHPVVLLRLGNHASEGLTGAVRPAHQAHLAADALQHAQAHLQLLGSLLHTHMWQFELEPWCS